MATLFELAARIQAAGGGESLLLILAKATLILAIARLLLAVIPRASAATRHLVATAALVGVAAMPVLTLVIPAPPQRGTTGGTVFDDAPKAWLRRAMAGMAGPKLPAS